MKSTADKVAVMQGFLEGKQIQFRVKKPEFNWADYQGEPSWNFLEYEFRIKPEPRKIYVFDRRGVLGHEAYANPPDDLVGHSVVEFVEVLK